MNRVNAQALSPNTTSEDVKLALSYLLKPSCYQQGKSIDLLEQWFIMYFKTKTAVSFSHGRTALFAILSCMGIGSGDEVIVQAFTCMVVPNMIVACKATPIYVDINSSLTINPVCLEKAITKRTKAIIVQHTFGIPADMHEIMRIADNYHVPVIEDTAHCIGGNYKGKLLGTFGIASIFSFGRDKAFSSVFGGLAITSNRSLGEKLRAYQNSLPFPKKSWIMQQLFHPIAFSIILPTYTVIVGKVILILFQKLGLLSFPVSNAEKKGKTPKQLFCRYPNALAALAISQLLRIDVYNHKRKVIARRYLTMQGKNMHKLDTAYLRFPIFVPNPITLRKYFKKNNIYLGNWYANILDPKGSDFKAVSYLHGSCPMAERLAKEIINLPTYQSMSDNDVTKVISLLQAYGTHSRSK